MPMNQMDNSLYTATPQQLAAQDRARMNDLQEAQKLSDAQQQETAQMLQNNSQRTQQLGQQAHDQLAQAIASTTGAPGRGSFSAEDYTRSIHGLPALPQITNQD